MGIFDEVKNLAVEGEQLAKQHPDQVKAALAKAEQAIDDQTGHKFSAQLQQGVAKADEFLQEKPEEPAPAPKP